MHLSLLSQVAYFKNGTVGQDNRKHALSVLFPKLAVITDSSDPCREQKEFFAVDVRLNYRWFFCLCALYENASSLSSVLLLSVPSFMLNF